MNMIPETISFEQLLFLGLAALAVVAAFNLILQRNPIYSALSLIVTLCVTAALFLLLSAPFIAAIQIIVYAGAIMVLFVFVIMLLNVREEEARTDRQRYLKWIAPPLFLALVGEVFFVIRYVQSVPPPIPSAVSPDIPPRQSLGSAESIAHSLFTDYVLPFEMTSVLILMAIVGAMLLARRGSKEEIERIEQALAADQLVIGEADQMDLVGKE